MQVWFFYLLIIQSFHLKLTCGFSTLRGSEAEGAQADTGPCRRRQANPAVRSHRAVRVLVYLSDTSLIPHLTHLPCIGFI
ncbi:hypothetical protein FKM82_016502 [Ascaphus truei]